MIITVIIFILTLLILVVIHELGHFLMAKKFGIKVLEFGFGIPPRAWAKLVGETQVSLNWLPFGGFVRLLGEDEVDKKILDNKRSFAAQIVWKRILVVVAGVAMNLGLAWLLFYLVLGFQGFKAEFPLLTPHQFIGVSQEQEVMVLIQSVAESSPAKQVGLNISDRILAINGEFIKDSTDLISKTKSLAGQSIKLTISDPPKKEFRSVDITPRIDPPAGQGPLGVALGELNVASIEYQGLPQRILAGPIHSVNLVAYSGKVMGFFFSQAIETKKLEPVTETVSGPVGITSVVNTILTKSPDPVLPYLDFVAILSLNLAVLNVLPFPALDGGRLFFLMVEALTKRKVHAEVERWIHTIGMVILLTLMILITFSDIRKLF